MTAQSETRHDIELTKFHTREGDIVVNQGEQGLPAASRATPSSSTPQQQGSRPPMTIGLARDFYGTSRGVFSIRSYIIQNIRL